MYAKRYAKRSLSQFPDFEAFPAPPTMGAHTTFLTARFSKDAPNVQLMRAIGLVTTAAALQRRWRVCSITELRNIARDGIPPEMIDLVVDLVAGFTTNSWGEFVWYHGEEFFVPTRTFAEFVAKNKFDSTVV
jgi:hypothetical protein